MKQILLAVAAAALPLAPFAAHAASAGAYPERPIRLIISSSPGTGADYFGRIVAVALTDLYKQQVVADNRTGKAGTVEGIKSGAYPYLKRHFLKVRADASPVAQRFVAFARSADGQRVLESVGC